MTVLVVAGARPQFVKAAALMPALRERGKPARLVHTGQHTDPRMVDAHFDGLGLPEPDRTLATSATSRSARMEEMAAALQEVIREQRPARVVALGDADSAAAAALAASRESTSLAHVEAGARSGEPELPEEENRILVDELSDLLFCSTAAHARNLDGRSGVHVVGDVMADLLLAREAEIRSRAEGRTGAYGVLTVHRAATADDPVAVRGVLDGVAQGADVPVVFARHPRTRVEEVPGSIELQPPLPYLDFLGLVAGARFVVTDSGGLQKEAYLLGVPCLTLRDATEWTETVEAGWNVLVGIDPGRIATALRNLARPETRPPLYGDGAAALRVAELV